VVAVAIKPMELKTVKMPPALWQEALAYADRHDTSASAVVREALRAWLAAEHGTMPQDT